MKKLKPFALILLIGIFCFYFLVSGSQSTYSKNLISLPPIQLVHEGINDEDTKLPEIKILKIIMDFVKRTLPVG
jgi:hypothetical protein